MTTPQSANAPEAAVKRQPHKHADLIIAWAKGAEIQCRVPETGTWVDIPSPNWNTTSEYRIKPEKKWVRNYEYWMSAAKIIFLVGCCTNEEHEGNLKTAPYFKRWITDRIYYE